MRIWFVLLFLVAGLTGAAVTQAGDPAPTPENLSAAITRAIPLLERGSAGSAEQRTCFTCHNQALPMLALAAARRRGFAVDEDNLQRQLKHTADHLARGRENYLAGRGQGGQVITAGYALWALADGAYQPDDLTAAVTNYLLEFQKQAKRWSHPGSRPPSSGSDFTTTYVALYGLERFGTEEQAEKIAARRKTVGEWLLSAAPQETEDRVFRLRSLRYVDGAEDALQTATKELLAAQREDGGWAQTADMASDAYATASVLAALLQEGGLNHDEPAVGRGLGYLLRTQGEDGSWHVATRAKPFQTYYESGFPHGKDQFISIAASSWATLALSLALPEAAPAGLNEAARE